MIILSHEVDGAGRMTGYARHQDLPGNTVIDSIVKIAVTLNIYEIWLIPLPISG